MEASLELIIVVVALNDGLDNRLKAFIAFEYVNSIVDIVHWAARSELSLTNRSAECQLDVVRPQHGDCQLKNKRLAYCMGGFF